MVIIASSYLAQNYEEEFKELWNGIFGAGGFVTNPIVYVNDIKIQNLYLFKDYQYTE